MKNEKIKITKGFFLPETAARQAKYDSSKTESSMVIAKMTRLGIKFLVGCEETEL